jgi:hypothetical protein
VEQEVIVPVRLDSTKRPVKLKEYGSNVQNLIDYLMTIEDRQKRTDGAFVLVELMRQLNPNMKDGQDHSQKLWDHLFYISDFKLDVDGPYPVPDPAVFQRKPDHISYKQTGIRYKYYGKSVQGMVDAISKLEDPEEREGGIIYLGKLMKSFYTTWNKDNVDDKVILKHILELSDGNLSLPLEKVTEGNLFDSVIPIRDWTPRNQSGGQGHHRKPFKKKNRNR